MDRAIRARGRAGTMQGTSGLKRDVDIAFNPRRRLTLANTDMADLPAETAASLVAGPDYAEDSPARPVRRRKPTFDSSSFVTGKDVASLKIGHAQRNPKRAAQGNGCKCKSVTCSNICKCSYACVYACSERQRKRIRKQQAAKEMHFLQGASRDGHSTSLNGHGRCSASSRKIRQLARSGPDRAVKRPSRFPQ
jgi:hypothetical protein